jgi:hypothetical protein
MLLGLLTGIDNIVELIRDLIAAIGDKIDVLLELAAIIQAVIDMIRALSTSGLFTLSVVTDEGVEGLKKAFLEAEERPHADVDREDIPVPAGDAVVGVCMLGGVGEFGTAAITGLWSLLGLDGMDSCISSFEDPFSEKAQRLKEQAEQSWEDTKAIAEEAWEGTGSGGESAEDLGFTGLWDQLTQDVEEQREDLENALDALGLTGQEADELARSNRNELIRRVEQTLSEGMKLDPSVLAHVEATRRARRRGKRSLAMGFGKRTGGDNT